MSSMMDRVKDYELKQQVEIYQAILESLPQSMFLLNNKKDIIGIFNASPETLAGMTADQIVGQNLMVYANDPASPFHQVCSMLNAKCESVLQTGEPLKFQYQNLDAYLEATITKISGDRILSQVRDISNIVVAQREIERKKHNELAMALMAGGLTSWSYDVPTQVVSSQQDNNVTGESLLLSELLALVDPQHRAKVCTMYDDILVCGKTHSQATVRVRNRNGDWQWNSIHAIPMEYAADGNVSLIVGSQKDVTAEHESHARLRKLVMENELILNNTNSGFVYLTPDLHVEWENVSKIFTDPEIICLFEGGALCASRCRHEQACSRMTVLQALTTKEKSIGKFQTSSKIVIEAIAQPVLGDDGQIEGVVLRLDDITEKEQAMLALAAAKEQAERSDKLKSAFLANMSHEIRTPLNSIVGFTQLIPHAENAEEQQGYIDIVNSNSEVLLNLINDILDLSKIEAGYFNCTNSVFNLSELFSELEMIFSHKKAADVELFCDVPQVGLDVALDRVRVSQVITNFLTNAVKFTKRGHIRMGYKRQGDRVRIFVEDTGIGMREDEVKRVFDRFEKFNLFEQGTGLGTAIAKAIVDAYHGEIGVESVFGQGSEFWVMLPLTCSTDDQLAADAEIAPATRSEDAELLDYSSMKILIAEDNDSNYLLIKSLLKNHILTRACNGLEAVELAAQEHFDLVLMDMRMPVMDGLEATRQIRQSGNNIPILAVTANAFPEDRQQAIDAGVDDFLTKPLNRVLLLDTIAHYQPAGATKG